VKQANKKSKTAKPMTSHRKAKPHANPLQFSDTKFMSSGEKRRVLGHWVKFLKSGFTPNSFTQDLYAHLINHASFIAHFDRRGFHQVYFADPSATQRFLDQFDRDKGCRSVEYGDTGWINDADYRDINGAMVDAATERMSGLRRVTHEREISKGRIELAMAEANLNRLLAGNGIRKGSK
jgi:hypothetical protein